MSFEDDNLIALDAGGFVDGLGVEPIAAEVGFGPSDKKCRCLMDFVETGKIEIAAIHNVDGPQLDDQLVEDIDIVKFPRGDDDHRRNVPLQIQKGMELYCSLAPPKLGPGEKGQTEVDGGRIQDINEPVPGLIGMGKGIAGDLPPYAQVIKFGLG